MSTDTLADSRTSARAFAIDKAHSEIAFQVRHLVTRVRGRFSEFEGTITYDEADPSRSSAVVSIQAASIDTSEASRDTHLRSADFFAADEFPTLTFRTTRIVPKGHDTFDVTGELTIRGITRSVTLATTFLGRAKDPWGTEKIGLEAETTVNRKEFGLVWNAPLETGGFLVGDEIKITLSIQAAAQK